MPSTDDGEFLFSVVVPVFNVEKFLPETLESLEQQSQGFFKRTQIILVDDGSVDHSLEICQHYQQAHPDNVIVIHQENLGVSAAKNRGIEQACGRYVGFLDSDDRYSRNVLRDVAAYFDEIAFDDVDVVSIPMYFFGARKGQHRLNRKFSLGNRVIDVSDQWQEVQLSAASCFVKKECLDELNLRFDTELILAEDAVFITKAIMRRQRYGLMSTAKYEYRKRENGGSVIDTFQSNPRSYLQVIECGWKNLISYYRNENGVLPRYVQNVVMHDIEWRLKQAHQTVLSPSEFKKYSQELNLLICQIDDIVILRQDFLGDIHKVYALKIKYAEDPAQIGHYDGLDFVYHGNVLWKADPARFSFHIDSLKVSKSHRLQIHGRFFGILTKEMRYGAFVNDRFIPAIKEYVPTYRRIINNGELVFEPEIVSFDIPLSLDDHVSFGVLIGKEVVNKVPLRFLNATHFPEFPNSYRVFEDVILVNCHSKGLKLQQYTPLNLMVREILHVRRLAWAMFKGKTISTSVPWYRLAALIGKRLKRSHIWIISDRPYAAGDNGEAFFRYLQKHKPPHTNIFFNLKKTSPDYKRIAKIGRVIDQDTVFGRLLFLLSDHLISSQADEVVINAFNKSGKALSDLFDFKFTFLQHGITKDDLSSWLNRYVKNISLFVTASPMEQASIATKDYGYGDNEVKLTGFPRFDFLDNAPKKKLILAPTWRSSIAGPVNSETGIREYASNFVDTFYFKMLQRLIADPRLNEALASRGYQAELFIHPNHAANVKDFQQTNFFTVPNPPHDYSRMFAEASILVTDYSSVAFDFAYLRKPVIYMQLDQEKFYQAHTYSKGYFDYERDGFGPVAKDFDTAVNAIVSLIENNGKIDSSYLERIDKFFAFNDRNNCARVLKEVLTLNAEGI